MDRDRVLGKDDEIRVPLDLLHEPGVTVGYIRVYGAIRDRAGFDARAGNFLLAWPAVETVAEEARVDRATVIRAAAWLVERGYLIRWRRPNRPSMYGIVIRRREFLARVETHGRADAIDWWESERGHPKPAAGGRKRKVRQSRRTARKSHARDYGPESRKSHACDPDPSAPGRSHGCDPGGGTDATDGGRTGATRSVDQLNCGSENCGATTAAQPAVSEIPSNDNGHHPHQIVTPQDEWDLKVEQARAKAQEALKP